VEIIPLNVSEAETMEYAEKYYSELSRAGVDVLLDDRDERPGVKFKDADLVGIPVRAVVGGKSFAAGQVELSLRRDRQKLPVPAAEALARTLELLERAR